MKRTGVQGLFPGVPLSQHCRCLLSKGPGRKCWVLKPWQPRHLQNLTPVVTETGTTSAAVETSPVPAQATWLRIQFSSVTPTNVLGSQSVYSVKSLGFFYLSPPHPSPCSRQVEKPALGRVRCGAGTGSRATPRIALHRGVWAPAAAPRRFSQENFE